MARRIISPLTERVFYLSQMRDFIVGKPTLQTIGTWISFGRRNVYTGKIVKLESVRLPNGMGTSLEAYERFIQALNDTGEEDQEPEDKEPSDEFSEKCS